MGLLRLDRFQQAPLIQDPFPATVVPDFVEPDDVQGILDDFPLISAPGLLPVGATQFGPRFGALIQELRSAAVARAFSEKFDLDLEGRATMVTVRGRCQAKDGRIHPDSHTKLATALLYLNTPWESRGGRLRLLRGPDDLDDVVAEVPPDAGTLVAFRVGERSFHGHEPFVGVRRYVMVNWMASGLAARREILRHRVSAVVKRMFPPTVPPAETSPNA